MTDDDFFNQTSEASQIKIRIVTKYFKFWSKVMADKVKNHGRKIAYYDLFSGPGKYEDGSDSTPILILKSALENPLVARQLITVFNDVDIEHARTLISNIKAIPDFKKLKFQPKVLNTDAMSAYNSYVAVVGNVPSFTFIDPFGYKDVNQTMLKGVLKNWGCDLLLFFNYNRINAAINNDVFDEHMTNLFGASHLIQLKKDIDGRTPHERVKIVIEAFAQSMKHQGFRFVLPFEFSRPDMKKISHHLVFVTKSEFAYSVMKDIMAQESSEAIQGVPSFKFANALTIDETPLLYLLSRPIEDLGEMLQTKFANRTLTCDEIFKLHHIGTRYVKKNYKAALLQLEEEGKIRVTPPADKRRTVNGHKTFGDKVEVEF